MSLRNVRSKRKLVSGRRGRTLEKGGVEMAGGGREQRPGELPAVDRWSFLDLAHSPARTASRLVASYRRSKQSQLGPAAGASHAGGGERHLRGQCGTAVPGTGRILPGQRKSPVQHEGGDRGPARSVGAKEVRSPRTLSSRNWVPGVPGPPGSCFLPLPSWQRLGLWGEGVRAPLVRGEARELKL